MKLPFGVSTIYGADGEHRTPYMTRVFIGRLRLHIFHRGDADPDCHDHPWDFWTFPLTSYVEEVAEVASYGEKYRLRRRVVPAWRWSFRVAEHCHRVLGRWSGRHERPAPGWASWAQMVDSYDAGGRHKPLPGYRPSFDTRRIVTIVWQGRPKRKWGFLCYREGRTGGWCWVPWKRYVFGGGKSAPCESQDKGEFPA